MTENVVGQIAKVHNNEHFQKILTYWLNKIEQKHYLTPPEETGFRTICASLLERIRTADNIPARFKVWSEQGLSISFPVDIMNSKDDYLVNMSDFRHVIKVGKYTPVSKRDKDGNGPFPAIIFSTSTFN